MNMLDVKQALQYGSEINKGSAMLFAEARDLNKWEEIKTSPAYSDLVAEIKCEAEKYLKSPIRTLPFSAYKIFDTTGSRKEYQREYFEHRGRLNTFAVLSMIFGEKEYLEALEDTIWAICDEYTWCLPAHLGGKSLAIIESLNNHKSLDGKIDAMDREHRQTVDLFASETAFALSEIMSLLENRLSEIVVYRARKEIRERILEPYCSMNTPFWWESCVNNWAAVCAGSVGAAAMYLIEEDEVLAPIIARIVGTMECFLSGYEEDGACTEGLGYWNYGFGFFVSFAALLKQRTGDKINLFDNEKVKQIALFQQKCYLSENKVVSFSDGSLVSSYKPGLTHYLKSIYNEVEIPDVKYRAGFTDDHCYRWTHNIRDLIWCGNDDKNSKLSEVTYWLKDSKWFITRKVDGANVFCFAAKGGHNAEPHNQNDVGNFILHVNGETLMTDLGAGEYTKQYFGPERYTIFCNGSQGHSVPIVEGCYQSTGRKYEARILDVDTSSEKDLLVMELADVYDNQNLKSLVRKFVFDKTQDVKLILKDKYCFANVPQSITERFITFVKPEISSAGKVHISGEKGSLDILFDAGKLECVINKEIFVNHRAVEEDVYTVDFHVESPDKEVEVEVVFMANSK